MATKKNILQKNEDSLFKLLLLVVAFVFAALVIPGIGYADALTSPSWWVSTVDFFTSVRTHVTSYWMFYTIGGAVLFTYLRRK